MLQGLLWVLEGGDRTSSPLEIHPYIQLLRDESLSQMQVLGVSFLKLYLCVLCWEMIIISSLIFLDLNVNPLNFNLRSPC